MGNWKNRDKRKLPWECNPLRKRWNQREQRHCLFLHSIVGSDSSFFLSDQSLLNKASEFTQKSLRTLRRIRRILTYLAHEDGGSELLRPNRSTTSSRSTTKLRHSPNSCNWFTIFSWNLRLGIHIWNCCKAKTERKEEIGLGLGLGSVVDEKSKLNFCFQRSGGLNLIWTAIITD